MLYYTKYANQKFDILNKYKVFFTKEQVEDAVKAPDKIEKKGKYLGARKDGVKVVYLKEGGVDKVITFFPVRNV